MKTLSLLFAFTICLSLSAQDRGAGNGDFPLLNCDRVLEAGHSLALNWLDNISNEEFSDLYKLEKSAFRNVLKNKEEKYHDYGPLKVDRLGRKQHPRFDLNEKGDGLIIYKKFYDHYGIVGPTLAPFFAPDVAEALYLETFHAFDYNQDRAEMASRALANLVNNDRPEISSSQVISRTVDFFIKTQKPSTLRAFRSLFDSAWERIPGIKIKRWDETYDPAGKVISVTIEVDLKKYRKLKGKFKATVAERKWRWNDVDWHYNRKSRDVAEDTYIIEHDIATKFLSDDLSSDDEKVEFVAVLEPALKNAHQVMASRVLEGKLTHSTHVDQVMVNLKGFCRGNHSFNREEYKRYNRNYTYQGKSFRCNEAFLHSAFTYDVRLNFDADLVSDDEDDPLHSFPLRTQLVLENPTNLFVESILTTTNKSFFNNIEFGIPIAVGPAVSKEDPSRGYSFGPHSSNKIETGYSNSRFSFESAFEKQRCESYARGPFWQNISQELKNARDIESKGVRLKKMSIPHCVRVRLVKGEQNSIEAQNNWRPSFGFTDNALYHFSTNIAFEKKFELAKSEAQVETTTVWVPAVLITYYYSPEK